MASYPDDVKVFTTKFDDVDDVMAVHINEIQDEITATETELDLHKSKEATQNEYGHVKMLDISTGKRESRFTIGTTQSGWTVADCDYLCDGTDDQEEINDAISELTNGGEIVILDGIYNISGSIIVENNIKIKGNGKSTILKCSEDSFLIKALDNVSISHLQIDGDTDLSCGIFVSGDSCEIYSLDVHSCDGEGIFSSGKSSLVRDCSVHNCGVGIKASGINPIIKHNICKNNEWHIYINGAINYLVTNNICVLGDGTGLGDYSKDQETIYIDDGATSYGMCIFNLCPGKPVSHYGSYTDSVYGNKHDEGNDMPIV